MRLSHGILGLILATGLVGGVPDTEARTCRNCGYVERIDTWRDQRPTTGAGTVIGAVVGGALGHTVGKGDGRKAATIGGAVAGGVIGHNVEKRQKGKTHYEITVRLDDGRREVVQQGHLNGVHEGSRVLIEDGKVHTY